MAKKCTWESQGWDGGWHGEYRNDMCPSLHLNYLSMHFYPICWVLYYIRFFFFLFFFLHSLKSNIKKRFFFFSFLPGHVISLAIQVNELAVIFCLFHNFYNTHSLVCQCLCTYNNNNNNNITNILMYLDLSIGRYLCSYRYTMWICDVRSLVQNR